MAVKERITNLAGRLIQRLKRLRHEVLQEQYNKYFAAFSYVPFIGWMLPMYVKKDVESCQQNSKQGLVLAVLCVGSVLILVIINTAMPKDWRIIRFILVILIYTIYMAYFTLCILAAFRAFREDDLMYPYVDTYVNRLEI
jgi:hypothetical protein